MKCDFPHTREPEPAWAQLISFLSPMFVLGKIKARSPSALFKQSRSELAAAGAGGLLGGTEGSAWSSSLLCPPLLAHVPLPCTDGIRLRQRPQARAGHAPPVSLHPALGGEAARSSPPLRTSWFPGLSLSHPSVGTPPLLWAPLCWITPLDSSF